MTFRIEIETDNDAFQGGAADVELVRILMLIARRVVVDSETGVHVVKDINGATVGQWMYEPPAGASPTPDVEEISALIDGDPWGSGAQEGTPPASFAVMASDIRNCPKLIMAATHYRTDGTCRCDEGAVGE